MLGYIRRGDIQNEIYSKLKNTRIVDVHQHLNPMALAPRTIDDIIFYHYLVTELIATGISIDKIFIDRNREIKRIITIYEVYKIYYNLLMS